MALFQGQKQVRKSTLRVAARPLWVWVEALPVECPQDIAEYGEQREADYEGGHFDLISSAKYLISCNS